MSKAVKRAWEDEDDEDFKSTHRDRAPQWLQKFEGWFNIRNCFNFVVLQKKKRRNRKMCRRILTKKML